MSDYSFFACEANEALHLSDQEKEMVERIVQHIQVEFSGNLDTCSNALPKRSRNRVCLGSRDLRKPWGIPPTICRICFKKETGKTETAQEFIKLELLELAQQFLLHTRRKSFESETCLQLIVYPAPLFL
ncbi:hypothetical protein ACX93W_04365 [Paenibacillus sp. CAU 1782]